MNTIFLSLGSNVTPYYHLKAAMAALHETFDTLMSSPIYQSEAFGFEGLPFLNSVVRVTSKLSLEEVVDLLKVLEQQLGRIRGAEKYSDRTIDIDILLFNDLVIQAPIVLPRKDILEHAFVLKPLADVAPTLKHPILMKPYATLWREFSQPMCLK